MTGQQIFEQWQEGMITSREALTQLDGIVDSGQGAVNDARMAVAMLRAERLSFYAETA